MATFDDFMKLDIRVGTIVGAKNFEKARKPAYQLEVDLGEELGVKRSSAQITQQYTAEELIGKQRGRRGPRHAGQARSKRRQAGLNRLARAVISPCSSRQNVGICMRFFV